MAKIKITAEVDKQEDVFVQSLTPFDKIISDLSKVLKEYRGESSNISLSDQLKLIVDQDMPNDLS